MITQDQLPEYIERSLPELTGKCGKEQCKSVYEVVKQLVKYTTLQMQMSNIPGATTCLSLVSTLYNRGNLVIKNAIENIFIYSFSHAFFYDTEKKKKLMEILPPFLYDLYKKQMIASHL